MMNRLLICGDWSTSSESVKQKFFKKVKRAGSAGNFVLSTSTLTNLW